MKQSLKKLLTGLSFTQEYLCLDKNDIHSTLSVSFIVDGKKFNVTDTHLFLGYKPLIIGIVADKIEPMCGQLESRLELTLDFRTDSGERVAELLLTKINHLDLAGRRVFIYEGIHGDHRFINQLHQWINRQREKFRELKGSDANLSGNNYDQVRIAYSIPRTISVITVGDGKRINMFPTDLHGSAGNDFYISSLRINGLANSQVEKHKRIVISEVSPNQFQTVYDLGKNHMKDLRSKDGFEADERLSFKFGYPLPKGVTCYRELQQINSFDCGIHRIHVYKVDHQELIGSDRSLLGHVHNYYGQWRIDNNLKSVFLIR